MKPGLTLAAVFAALFCNLASILSQQHDYDSIFGADWQKAEAFVKENRLWMEPLCNSNNIDFNQAIAVIFPELVRYSALRDKMEVSLLKTLYINLGKHYANFSVGEFQMKPSFAEYIHANAKNIQLRSVTITLNDSAAFENIREFRKTIVINLESRHIQTIYLIAFLKMAAARFNTEEMNREDKIRFLATLYNFGPGHDEAEVRTMIDKKFYSTKLFAKTLYSYADVSLFWYNNCTSAE